MSSAWTYKIDVGENNLDGKSMHRFFEFFELEKTFASFRNNVFIQNKCQNNQANKQLYSYVQYLKKEK